MLEKIDVNSLELQERVVSINRVSKTVKGGRIFKFAALVVVGDGNGLVGCGLGKSSEVPGPNKIIINGCDKQQVGGSVRAIVEMAGIKDIRAKSLRSNNPRNVVNATIEGLKSLRTAEQVAAIRGKNPVEA